MKLLEVIDIDTLPLTTATRCYKYALKHGPSPELESIIAKSAKHSFNYAKDVLRGPFPWGEDAISKDDQYSYNYANDVLKKPFPLGEDAIATNSFYALLYASQILKGPFKKGESIISMNGMHSLRYAMNTLQTRFKLGEPAIQNIKNHPIFKTKGDEYWVGYLIEFGHEFSKDEKLDILQSNISNFSVEEYNQICNAFFHNNKILQTKWIAYGKNMRNQ